MWAALLLALGAVLVVIGGIGLGTVDDDDNDNDDAIVAGTTTTAAHAATTTTTAETAEAFLEVLGAAIRGGDEQTLFSILHPAVLDRFGEATCRAYLADFEDPTAVFTVASVGEPIVYAWTTGDETTDVPDTLTVEVDRVRQGENLRTSIHLGRLGSRLSWFTDCGGEAS